MTNGTADIAAKLVDAQRIEAGCGEGIVRIHSIVAEVFIDRAVHVIATDLVMVLTTEPRLRPLSPA